MRAGKALVMVTLSDSFRIWPPSTTLWRDFQKDAEQFAFPHNRLSVGRARGSQHTSGNPRSGCAAGRLTN